MSLRGFFSLLPFSCHLGAFPFSSHPSHSSAIPFGSHASHSFSFLSSPSQYPPSPPELLPLSLKTLVEKGRFASPHLCRMKGKTTQKHNLRCMLLRVRRKTSLHKHQIGAICVVPYRCATHIAHVHRTLNPIRRTSLSNICIALY